MTRPTPWLAEAGHSLLSDVDLHLFNEGRHADLAQRLGAHPVTRAGVAGVAFAVWAPAAVEVTVAGDWNGWAGDALAPVDSSGIWEGFVPEAFPGQRYKFRIRTQAGHVLEKTDPMARHAELPPGNASIVEAAAHEWTDDAWLVSRPGRQASGKPLSIYEVHLGSWRRVPEDGDRVLSYRELATQLGDHCVSLGFTHVELLPIMEHPFDGSWGYQVTGFFAPTSRYGTPDDFRWFVDHLHGRGIGVILDWVPAHFPDDAHGLARFDGTALYEHDDPKEGRHPDWGSLIFNYGRHEVRSFLLSSAMHWIDEFHVDGLRVDAVASMLYRDYSRAPGEWVPNRYGGRENLEAVDFLRQSTDLVRARHPDVLLIAEESTAWPGVSAPTDHGGLGFTHKWDMGWMHDTLGFLEREPVHRRFHQNDLTFRGLYVGSERWVLPLSHDEVVHGKGALLAKMPGDDWQRRAGLRLLYGYQWGSLGAKLLFMGGELGQHDEWSHTRSLDWHLLDDPAHASLADWLRALNGLYRSHPSLEDHGGSFWWIACVDSENSVFAWARQLPRGGNQTIWLANFTPVPRPGYRVGLPEGGHWRLLLNGDDAAYGGSGHPVVIETEAEPVPWDGQAQSALLTLPPLAILVYGR